MNMDNLDKLLALYRDYKTQQPNYDSPEDISFHDLLLVLNNSFSEHKKQVVKEKRLKDDRSELVALISPLISLHNDWLKEKISSHLRKRQEMEKEINNFENTISYFSFLDVLSHEFFLSNLIDRLLSSQRSPNLAPELFCKMYHFCHGVIPQDKNYVFCLREKSTSGMDADQCKRNTDITLGPESLGKMDVFANMGSKYLIIEVKVKSQEHDAQTELYFEWARQRLPQCESQIGFIFLSHDGHGAISDHFKSMSFLDLWMILVDLALDPVSLEKPERELLFFAILALEKIRWQSKVFNYM